MERKVKIVIDSTCDLNDDIIKENDIDVVPLGITFGQTLYQDGVDINTDELYKKVEETGNLPKTSAATVAQLEDVFDRYTKEGYDIVFTGIGSKLSSTIQNATIAKNDLDDDMGEHVFIVDSQNLSTGTGLLVMKMCDFKKAGLSAAEIKEKTDEIVPRVRAQFSVSDLTYLHKGGRCSGTARFFGTMLKIRPILRVINGIIELNDKAFGKYEKALDIQVNDITSVIDDCDYDYLFITHTRADEEAKYILAHLSEDVKKRFRHIYITNAGCTISSHCGPHTIGVLYIRNSKVA